MNRLNFFKITVVIVIILVITLIILNVIKKNNNYINIDDTQSTKNHTENENGTKTNISEELKIEQNIEGLNIKCVNLEYLNNDTKLITNVTNTTSELKNVNLKIYFCDEKGRTIEESFGYLGKILPNETKQIKTRITTDVSNTKNIKYEIVK